MKEIPADWERKSPGNTGGPSKFLQVEGVDPEWSEQVGMTVLKEAIERITELAKSPQAAEEIIAIVEEMIVSTVDQTWPIAFNRGVWAVQNFATKSNFQYVNHESLKKKERRLVSK